MYEVVEARIMSSVKCPSHVSRVLVCSRIVHPCTVLYTCKVVCRMIPWPLRGGFLEAAGKEPCGAGQSRLGDGQPRPASPSPWAVRLRQRYHTWPHRASPSTAHPSPSGPSTQVVVSVPSWSHRTGRIVECRAREGAEAWEPGRVRNIHSRVQIGPRTAVYHRAATHVLSI